jgi:lipopolysaccharide export system protein LptA
MFYRLLVLLCLPLYLLSAQYAVASSSDVHQPINIEADRAELDQQKHISTYTGNVVLSQGGIKIKAATVKVFTQDGKLHRVTAEGNPVQFSQHREDEKDIHGVSQRMEYKTQPKHVLLLGKAELWQGNSHFSGERIDYDPGQEKVIATGKGVGTSEGNGRVKIILHPDTIKQKNGSSKTDGSTIDSSTKDKP